jgi:hypothetical protein
MPRLSFLRAGIPVLIAAAAAALSTVGFAATGSGASQSASIAVIAIDANPQGNGPRTVGSTEDCVSAALDQPVDIDIVVPSPGVPVDRGIAAYQFSIMYDPAVVWIADDDSEMLLAQAAGSNVIPIADPKPDRNGVYQSWAVDFGPSGIEPAGSSETGPGVIARITLLPRSEGISTLTLSNVLVIGDASERISPESVQSGTIQVGEPCDEDSDGGDEDIQEEEEGSEEGQQTTPSPDSGDSAVAAATSLPAPDQDTDGDGLSDAQEQQLGTNPNKLDTDGDGYSDNDEIAQGSDPLDASSTPEASPPAEVPNGGGPPPPKGDISPWLIVAGLAATLGGASLLIAGKLTFRGLTRRDSSPDRD